jgi:PIN domain nuclease of toxin-antitoxin system
LILLDTRGPLAGLYTRSPWLAERNASPLTLASNLFFAKWNGSSFVLPITHDVCVQALAFPPDYPKDPADRIIGATAVSHGLTLVTADRAIRQSGAVPTIW